MFNKSSEGDTLPAARPGSNAGGRSHLSSDLKITGNITSTGTVEVMGEVQGDVDAKTLVIGTEGQVSGKVRAEAVEVRGHLNGSAACVQFTLRSSSVSSVTVTYDQLVIESGAEIEGKFAHAATRAQA